MRCFQSLLILILAAVITAPAANAQTRPQPTYDKPQFSQAADALARQLVRRYGRANKKSAAVFYVQAEQLTRQKNYRAALPLYGRAIAAGLREYRHWQRYAWVLATTNRNSQSLAAAYAAYRAAQDTRKPRDMSYALYLVGFNLEALRRYDQAIGALEASIKIRRRSDAASRLTRLIMRHRQQVMSSRVEKETNTPRICLTFSRQLPAASPAMFDQYVKLSPAVKAAFAVRGRVLCIEGVNHGTTYDVTVREGLPEAKGALRTTKQAQYRISVPNRDMRIGFRGKTFILPRVGRRGIPMLSVNVARAQIRVLRINDRNLVHQINDSAMYRLLTARRGNQIANTQGEEIWRGTIDIQSKMNRQVGTAIPVAQILKSTKPGIYILMARPWRKDGKYGRWDNQATQYLVVSDLGIATYRGGELAVYVRSFATGGTKAGVRVSLIARNNKVLGTATTDADGRVTFAAGIIRGSGGNRPAALMVRTKDGDFNFQNLTGPAFDLSDRGVSGRAAPGPVDGYVYTERGVYRPGETVHVVTLVRDDKANAITGMPVTFKLFRPDGVQARRFVVKDAGNGGYRLSIPMSKASRTGGWTLRAYVNPKGRAIGRVLFQVEDFVPEKLEMTLKAAIEALRPGQANSVLVDGRFLYGAAAADLTVEASLRLQMDWNPYPKWKGYTFGLVTESWRSKQITLKATRTDAKGRAVLPVALDGVPETTRPLKAVVRVSLLESGGRALERTISIPVRAKKLVLGMKLANGEGSVPAGVAAKLQVIALNQAGERRAAAGLNYRLVREVYQYYWYFSNGYWRYRVIRRDEPVKKGSLDITAGAPGALTMATQQGRYRIEVRDKATGAAASVRYYVGWWTPPGRDNVPDKLTVRLDKKRYLAGDTAKVFLRPPFDGVVHLVVATNKILVSRTVKVSRSGTTVDLKVDGSWGPGAYVMATAYRPTNASQKVGPSRAIGLAYVAQDFGKRTLSVKLEGPEMIRPRGKVDLTVRVGNVPAGEKVFVTVAAVDEGILSLTGYKSPAPQGHFYAKRRLALDVRDDYGRLIDAFAGAFGKIRQGGDAAGAKSMGALDASSIKTVSLFSGIVTVGADGTAKVTLDVPDFNGRLRVMAVAWSKTSVGSSERPLTVRDPVVSLITLPRFLAPGDNGAVTVSLNNVDGQAGRYTVSLKADGAAVSTGKRAAVVRALAKGGRSVERFVLIGRTLGVAKITMTLSGPGGFKISRSWDIAVRPAQAPVTTFSVRKLAPGQRLVVAAGASRAYLPGTMRVLMSFANTPDLGVPGILRTLARYPYGCAEQTTSKALPMLYVADVARSIGVAADEAAVRSRVQGAVSRVLNMQQRNGGFGMWSSSDSQGGWLTAYVGDFLTQAKKRGYVIPEYPYSRMIERLKWVVRNVKHDPPNLPVIAYAYYVLAANKETSVSDLRYFHDNWLKKLPTALAKAQVGAALALYGDGARAKTALAAAMVHTGRPTMVGRYWRTFVRDYGSELRDKSGVLVLAGQSSQSPAELAKLVAVVAQLRGKQRHLSTQEKAWLLLAAHATSSGSAKFSVAVGQDTVKDRVKPHYVSLRDTQVRRGIAVRNTGKNAVWHGVTVTGIPNRPLPATSQGFTIKRIFYTLDGKRANLTRVRQSDVLVAVIQVTAKTRTYHQALIVDLLPAGFELENARLRGRSTGKMKWLPKLAGARYIDKRDDRFVAAIDIGGRGRSFHMAYLVRAVTPGTFRLPAAHIEDMYRPSIFGRDKMGFVRIQPRR